MSKISLVYNLDTRRGFLDDYTTTIVGDGGCRSVDFFTDGLLNKLEFLSPHEIELIIYVDIHEPIPDEVLEFFDEMINTDKIHQLVVRPHTSERFGKVYGKANNDLIYAESLSMATGDYVVHFDSDMFAYKKEGFDICQLYFGLLETYAFVSMPSIHSPNCTDKNNPIFKGLGYQWASTRFFICKKETIPSLDEMKRCFDNKYLRQTYGKPAQPNCLEHILGVMAGKDKVIYPPFDLDNYIVASWASYHKGTFKQLGGLEYKKIKEYVMDTCGGIHGANDVLCEPYKIKQEN